MKANLQRELLGFFSGHCKILYKLKSGGVWTKKRVALKSLDSGSFSGFCN